MGAFLCLNFQIFRVSKEEIEEKVAKAEKILIEELEKNEFVLSR